MLTIMQESTTTTTTKEAIKIMVFEKFKTSGGLCGIYPAEIVNELKLQASEVTPVITELSREKFIKERPGQHGTMLFFNPKNNFKNIKMSANNATVETARDLFQKLPIDTQKKIKSENEEIYNSIFGKNVIVKESVLNDFFEKYQPLNEKIKTLDDLEKLPLEKQVLFKDNFPAEYKKIMNINPAK